MKKMVNICVVVFNRYDLLKNLIRSLDQSEVVPATVCVIDRGHDEAKLKDAIERCIAPVCVVDISGQSLAAAWNWFAKNIPEERIIANDDIEFGPSAIGEMISMSEGFVGLRDGKSGPFACFLIRDGLYEKIGPFDENISPDYIYFADWDYIRRMQIVGVPVVGIGGIKHGMSKSFELRTPEEIEEHHKQFLIAQQNYMKKWHLIL